jgi:hypothetical protein
MAVWTFFLCKFIQLFSRYLLCLYLIVLDEGRLLFVICFFFPSLFLGNIVSLVKAFSLTVCVYH